MENLEEIKEQLKNCLSEKRYIHSVGVMNMCEHLAKIHNVDVEEAKLAGLLHDIAKEMKDEEFFEYARQNGIELSEIEKINTKTIHGKVGADIAVKKYGVSKEVENAIKYHTTTSPEMDKLAKIVFVSDKVELNRTSTNYDIEYERFVAEKDLDMAVLIILNTNIKRLICKGLPIAIETLETRNKIIMEQEEFKSKL